MIGGDIVNFSRKRGDVCEDEATAYVESNEPNSKTAVVVTDSELGVSNSSIVSKFPTRLLEFLKSQIYIMYVHIQH